MTGLLLKDFLSMRAYSRTVVFVVIWFLVLGALGKDLSLFATMSPVMLAMVGISSLSYDKQCGWDSYVVSMPVTRNMIVLSRYVFTYLSIVLGGIFASVVSVLCSAVLKNDPLQTLFTCCGSMVGISIAVAIMFPLVYRYGVERSRIILLAIVVLPLALMLMVTNSGIKLKMPNFPGTALAIAGGILFLACICLSYLVSCHIYSKKEF